MSAGASVRGGAGPAKAKIAFARVDAIGLPEVFQDAIRRSLRPGTAYQRYSRNWRMGQWEEQDGLIHGRIGFETPTQTDVFHEDAADFVAAAIVEGTTSPFVLDLETQRIAFQVRSSVIRPHSFTGAMQALLNEASDLERWRVRVDSYEIDWRAWVESVDRISQLRIRLERPNPNYAERERVKHLIEDTNARMVELVLTASQEGEGIDITDEFVVEAIEHASHHGKWSAEGEREAEPVSRWHSDETAAIPERTIEADPETNEANFDAMARELRRRRAPTGSN